MDRSTFNVKFRNTDTSSVVITNGEFIIETSNIRIPRRPPPSRDFVVNLDHWKQQSEAQKWTFVEGRFFDFEIPLRHLNRGKTPFRFELMIPSEGEEKIAVAFRYLGPKTSGYAVITGNFRFFTEHNVICSGNIRLVISRDIYPPR